MPQDRNAVPNVISVLYVDDEPDLLDICRIFLERDGLIRVATAISAPEALAMLRTGSYDAIISDYQMPEMDGIAFLKRVRESGDSIPFILFTGRGREDVVMDALNNGADFYLQKGGDPRSQFVELIHKIRIAVDRRKALEDLRIHAERLDMAQEIGNIGSWEYDVATRTIWASGQAFRIFGMDRPSGTVPIDLIESCFEERESVRSRVVAFFESRSPYDIEYAINPADGSSRKIIHSIARYVNDKTGRPVRLVGVIQDVTAKKRAEEELREREAMLNTAQQVAHVGSWEYDMVTGRLIWSDELYRMLGHEPGSIAPDEETSYSFMHPDDREKVREAFRKITESGGGFSLDIRVILPDGKIRHVRDQGELRRGSTGAPVKIVGTLLDITRQVETEARLFENQEKHRLLLDESSDPIFSFSRNGTYEYVNRAFAEGVGIPAERIIGKKISDVFPMDEAEKRYSVLQEVFRTGRKKEIEVRVPRADGDRYYLTTVTPIRDESGTVLSVICSSKEITDRRNAEIELRRSEEKFRSFVENASDIVYTMTAEGKFSYISPNITELLGYGPDEINDHVFGRYFHPDDLPLCRKFLAELVATGGKKGGLEYRLLHRDGTWRWFVSNNSAIRNPGGDTITILGIAREITDRKRAEKALIASEERYRNLVDNLRDAIWETTPELRFTYVSRYGEKILECPRDEILGRTLFDFLAPSSAVYVREQLARRLSSGFPPLPDPQTYVVEMITKTGNRIWIEVNAVPILDPDRKIITGFQGISRDITRRKRAESALADRLLFQQTLIDTLPYPVFIKDATGRFVGCNRAYEREFETTREYILGKTVLDLEYIEPAERERFHAEDMDVIRTTGRRSYELSIPYADGRVHQTLYSVDGFRLSDGEPGGLIGMLVDISDRKQMENALKIANQQLGLLTSITRHDINNKITGIHGYLELMEEQFSDPALSEYLVRLTGLVRAIESQIEFTRIYQDLGSAEPQWQEIGSLLSDEQFPPDIRLDSRVTGIEIFADPMLQKVFFNLLDNTLRHGGKVSRVTVSTRDSPQGMILVWEDDGIGIPEDQKEKIFDRGFGKNTGLGLFLVREILSLTRITIRETGDPGKGARFEILVPGDSWRQKPGGT